MTPNNTAIPDAQINAPPTIPSWARRRGHEAGPVHQVAEDQPVPDADDEAGAEQERPVVQCDEGPADRDERGRVRAHVLLQRHDRQEADDADGDEDRFDDARRDVAEREGLVLPLEDREQHDRGPDVRDDEQHLEERAQEHLGVVPPADDEVPLVENVVVERERRNRGDEGDHEEHPGESRSLLRIHLRAFLERRSSMAHEEGGANAPRTSRRTLLTRSRH